MSLPSTPDLQQAMANSPLMQLQELKKFAKK
jgi:hypothetical protein